ncbi:MAG: transposase [Candidatus Hydrogenedentes bacterium]|nr:transposase [Candidatus Hydrogenedentota bacterium]
MARIVVPGFPHHVTQRGNRRADIFERGGDREAYLRFLKKCCDKRGLSVWAYCLMSNHVHPVVVPGRESSLSEGLRDAHTVYAMYFNSRTQMSGHVWQGRFFSCPLDDSHGPPQTTRPQKRYRIPENIEKISSLSLKHSKTF